MDNKKIIKVYSSPACPYCLALKKFLKKYSFEFEDIDVSKDKKYIDELMEKSGQMGVPVIEINGEIIVGFDREKICKILGIKE